MRVNIHFILKYQIMEGRSHERKQERSPNADKLWGSYPVYLFPISVVEN
jgi:hypothetical protein